MRARERVVGREMTPGSGRLRPMSLSACMYRERHANALGRLLYPREQAGEWNIPRKYRRCICRVEIHFLYRESILALLQFINNRLQLLNRGS
ncbi:hypothetical protein CEXT_559801 [Caerostris extrusa]|uniref:Uncharacterized protein n=1 Tax=Caerostris extrusa TaxID=172846 RepID=A0AAV4YCW8_CAEEX|nr:hypothetical protein CEXT_559801 [Caerostris extrusa]